MSDFLFLFSFFLLVKLSYQIDCTSQAVAFNSTFTQFTIQSDPTDLTSKTCKYTFTVPKYFIPHITLADLALTGDNKITAKQYSDYGGAKSYQLDTINDYPLAPVNFTLEIALPSKTANDRFGIIVYVVDATPYTTALTFLVPATLGQLIDSDNILGNSSTIQQFDDDHPLSIFSIRVAVFTESDLIYRSLQQIHIYDVGLYKGNLYDVIVAENASQICSGTSFAIVNTNSGVVGIYTILISPPYKWSDQVFVRPSQQISTDSYTATNGLTVFHEIRSWNMGTVTPTIYQQISFRGNGTLDVYAGCATWPIEERRIATITPSNAASYEKLMLFGRCRTYVLNQGVFQWSKEDTYFTDYRHSIGRRGVIMSDTFPYPYTDRSTTRNYLIQAPDDKTNIIVAYNAVSMSIDTVFNIKSQKRHGSDENYNLATACPGFYNSPVSYQQYINYTESVGQHGFLVRYEVMSGAGGLSIFAAVAICILVVI